MSRFARLSFTDFARLVDSFPWKRKIRAVHVHHTWRPNHGQWQGLRSVEGMWRHHTRENGWSDIAQHITIDPEGFVWTGRNWNQPPASARGFNGDATAGPFMFEVVGDFDVGCDPFAGGQKETVLKTTACLLDKFDLGIEAVRFHNEMSSKSCPGTAIDRLSFFEEVKARRVTPGARARRTRADAEGPTYDKQSLDAVRKLIEGGPEANEPESAEPDDGPELDRGAPPPMTSRAEARGGLSASDRQKLRRHVINSRNGRLVASGTFVTTPADVERIFAEHIREFAREQDSGKPLRLVFFAHGGLVGEESGLGIALRQIDWWLANGVYPVFFVWETGLLETLGQILSPSIGVLPGGRGIFDAIGDAKDAFLETLAHTFGGVGIWSQMKLSAARGVDPGGATAIAVEQLHRLLDEVADRPIELHAIGHSAGSIFHSWFIPATARRRNTSFKTLSLLAPAIRVDDFELRLLPAMGRTIDQTTIFTMAKDVELADSLLGIYGKSLLYFIFHGLEPKTDTPILGLDESLHADAALRTAFGLMGESSGVGGSVVWSVSQATTGPSASASTTHGGFDDDPPTMNAVLRRVLGLNHEPLEQEFPAGARAVEPAVIIRQPVDYLPEPWRSQLATRSWTDFGGWPTPLFPALPPAVPAPSPPAPAAGPVAAPGRRRALCIGINTYPTAPLFGCVADADLWARTLAELGFEAPIRLADEEARRERILTELERLLVTSRAGDVVVFQYAGHGTQLDDLDGDETDALDEAICPVDFHEGAYIVDDDFAAVFARIPDGVSLTCFFDCCHSGTNTRLAVGAAVGAGAGARPRFMRATPEMQERHRAFRARASQRSPARDGGRNSMRQVVFAACRPEEVAWESGGQGDFTRLAVPLLTRSVGTPHRRFVEAVVEAFGAGRRQTPELDCADSQLDAPLFGAAAAGGRASPAVEAGTGPAEAWARVAESVAVALRGRP